jgi:hypothetical protein
MAADLHGAQRTRTGRETMNTLKWIVAGLLVGIAVSAFRDFERGAWLAPALPDDEEEEEEEEEVGEEEPVLGYDGMDQETVLDWIENADLDRSTLRRIIRYEEENRSREPVLEALEELLG